LNARPIDLTRKSLIKALEYDDLTIPVLPKTANEIMMMSQDPDADISTLSQLIHLDQSIASHVLHISNSATYGGFSRVESIDEAVARLGMKLLSEIAISVSIQKNIFDIPAFRLEIQEMWRHSLASAIFAKEISQYCRLPSDTLYLCGLLHEIGKPVTLFAINNLPMEVKGGLSKEHVLLLVEEFHISVGTIVTRQWELPETIQLANLYYRDWQNAPRFQAETAITYISDRLATAMVEEEPALYEQMLEDPAMSRLALGHDRRDQLLEFRDEARQRMLSMAS
jgi:HD-like signal output (HDOD) protein